MTAAMANPRGAPLLRLRHAMVIAHRWMGLSMAVFLVVLGLTGSLIAFNDEIEAWISPQLFRVTPPYASAPLLDPFVLRERVLAQYPGTESNWVELSPRADRSTFVALDAAAGSAPLANDQVFADPYTGRVLGARLQGDLTQGWKNFMPFIYALHTSLALGDVGTWALGIAALVWTIDCFVGFYLTLPARRESRAVREPRHRTWQQWCARWIPAWKVRWRATSAKWLFDLHRAGGLWTWVMLFVLAWSGAGFNLAAVYQPVMRTLAGYVAPGLGDAEFARLAPKGPPLGWTRAHEIAKAAMQDAATANGFAIKRERLIRHDPARGLYEYRVLSTLDVGEKLGNTTLFIDAGTGKLLHVDLPTGEHAGNTIDTWMSSIHTAAWGGLTMQTALCVVGLVVVLLSGTGVWIWWRRTRGRRSATLVREPRAAARPNCTG